MFKMTYKHHGRPQLLDHWHTQTHLMKLSFGFIIVQESKTHLVKSERLGPGQQEGYQLTTNISIL